MNDNFGSIQFTLMDLLGLQDALARKEADEVFPAGCSCADCNDGGCDWCQAYYHALRAHPID